MAMIEPEATAEQGRRKWWQRGPLALRAGALVLAVAVIAATAVLLMGDGKPANRRVHTAAGATSTSTSTSLLDVTSTTALSTSSTVASPTTTATARPVTTPTTAAATRIGAAGARGGGEVMHQGGLYTFDLATGSVTRLYESNSLLDASFWSADSKWVGVSATSNLYRLASDGSGVGYKYAAVGAAVADQLSRDQTKVAGIRIVNGVNYDLVLGAVDGSGRHTISHQQVGDVAAVRWSPSGDAVYFVGGGKLWRVGADGSGLKQLAPGSTAHHQLCLGGDGRVAFGATDGNLYVINADGSGKHSVMTGTDVNLPCAWSPDTGSIVVSKPNSIEVVRADGTGGRSVASSGAFAPTWSPDGTRIAYADNSGGGTPVVVVVNADGTGRHTVLTPGNGSYVASLVWSPDGTRLAVNTGGGGEGGPSSP
ncbi:MAG: TolB protein [Actinomycetota bacterium]|jgi:Tol biopolymer transport system component|nr:TolB protein [Actinomycetota bacterium]